ncbi:hypothetical protein CC2G_011105 [Coprinopsis cinerea AmutBmut pab1-1]|nr:hypothetical protein CC2G_011105 [Coprinopsis cinerea AmutBmut pab1-1]
MELGTIFVFLLTQRRPYTIPQITPSQNLTWHECYSTFECARLEVPLDYDNPTGPQAVIALTRKPAGVPTSSADYKGPILFNPGGPGQSGVEFVLGLGDLLAMGLGPQFDLVGFDPRGIARSTPRTSIFATEAERAFFGNAYLSQMVNGTGEGVAKAWGIGHVIGKLAKAHDEEEGDYLQYINTPNTARDMMRILERYGEEKLKYWGISYGSVLGATFATMFPDKVERMVLDGVVDLDDHYTVAWGDNLQDADNVLEQFFTCCAAAGPSGCAFHQPSAADIKASFYQLANQIRNEPIPVYTTSTSGAPTYGLLDYSKFQTTVFYALYSPFSSFAPLAEVLAQLADGNPEPFFAFDGAQAFRCDCGATGGEEEEEEEEEEMQAVTEGTAAVLCTDGAKVPQGLGDTQTAFAGLSAKSEWAGVWAWMRLSCLGWPKKTPAASFEGPYAANTSHPILFIGSTADPVTPLANANKVSQGFNGSVVLTQDAPGHTSLGATSFCTQLAIREYFINGTLPAPDTVCDVIGSPFPGGLARRSRRDVEDSFSGASGLEGVDVEQWMDAVEKLSKEAAARHAYGPLRI